MKVQNVKISCIKILLMAALFVFVNLHASATEIYNLNSVYSGGLVKISWQSGTEMNIKEYTVEKSSDNSVFHKLTSATPKGSSSSYTVFDSNPHTKAELYYRIKTVYYNNETAVSESVTVIINASGISATWGSIKALFR
jgi:hypothetical protein